MAENVRNSNVNIGPGPYLAKVVNHLDPSYMGSLEVTVLKSSSGLSETQSANVIVKYCSPFWGNTSAAFEGNNSSDFNDVQKSYGFWMVPPDIGTTVMVIFIAGDINQGYWFGCVPDMYQNHMTPGIAASQFSAVGPGDEAYYGTKLLPVAEFHKASRNMSVPNPDTFTKPIHPFADRLLEQGLLIDNIRGVTSTSARREVPSQVFGISTPGPVDKRPNAPRKTVGFAKKEVVTAPVSRLGGTTFVMDDGDKDGQNELVRIRTRTGHQILMHNSSDLIYIGNAKGTAWIELTSAGKIDIYGEDSISIRTKGDFNFHADRDFNLEAGRNFNIATQGGDFNLNVQKNIKIIADDYLAQLIGNYNVTAADTLKVKSGGSLSISTGAELKQQSSGKFSIASAASVNIGGNSRVDITSAEIRQTAGRIELNGPAAEAPNVADVPSTPVALNLYSIPQRDSAAGWSNGNFYKATDLLSIMQRVPSHEPWDQHENINPSQFTLAKTSSDITPTQRAANGAIIPGAPSANPPYPARNGPANDRGKLHGQPFPWSTDQPFLTKVKEVATALSFDPIDMLGIMHLESAATFDPAIDNGVGKSKDPEGMGFVGLIQFGRDACNSLKVSKKELSSMSRVQQMDYVHKYFNKLWGWPNAKCPKPTLGNIYMTVFLPAFRFAPADQVIASANGTAQQQSWYFGNPAFDPAPKQGVITPAQVEAAAASHKRDVLAILKKAGVGDDLVVPA